MLRFQGGHLPERAVPYQRELGTREGRLPGRATRQQPHICGRSYRCAAVSHPAQTQCSVSNGGESGERTRPPALGIV